MIKFGPSGLCAGFSQSGYKHTIEAGKWLNNQGLNCFEYSFGRGVQIKSATANDIGKEFAQNDVEISVHAPYFINLAKRKTITDTLWILLPHYASSAVKDAFSIPEVRLKPIDRKR